MYLSTAGRRRRRGGGNGRKRGRGLLCEAMACAVGDDGIAGLAAGWPLSVVLLGVPALTYQTLFFLPSASPPRRRESVCVCECVCDDNC